MIVSKCSIKVVLGRGQRNSEIVLSSGILLQELVEVYLGKLIFQLTDRIMKALVERMIVQNCVIELPIQAVCMLLQLKRLHFFLQNLPLSLNSYIIT